MSPNDGSRRASDRVVSGKECEDRHKEERAGRRWALGILMGAVVALTLWGGRAAYTNGAQNALLSERAKGEDRILEELGSIKALIMTHVGQHGTE